MVKYSNLPENLGQFISNAIPGPSSRPQISVKSSTGYEPCFDKAGVPDRIPGMTKYVDLGNQLLCSLLNPFPRPWKLCLATQAPANRPATDQVMLCYVAALRSEGVTKQSTIGYLYDLGGQLQLSQGLLTGNVGVLVREISLQDPLLVVASSSTDLHCRAPGRVGEPQK